MRAVILILLSITIIGCQSNYYSSKYAFEQNTWLYDNPVKFTFAVEDTISTFDMVLSIDHTDQYPYQNLYVKTKSILPTDSAVVQDLSLELANEGGFWFGDCSGTNCSLDIPIQSNFRFTYPGTYHLELEQFTRSDTLKGLRGIGLRIVEVE